MPKTNCNPQGKPPSTGNFLRGFTQVDNFLLDVAFPLVARKFPKYPSILLTIIRKTVGWHKQFDWISLTQFQRCTGAGRKHIVDGLRFWETVGLIRKSRRHGYRGSVAYEFLVSYDQRIVTGSLIELVGRPDWFAEGYATSSPGEPPLVRSSNTQKKVLKIKQKKESGSASPHRKSAPAPEGDSENSKPYRVPEVIYA